MVLSLFILQRSEKVKEITITSRIGSKKYKGVSYYSKKDVDKTITIIGETFLDELSKRDKEKNNLYISYTGKYYELENKICGRTLGYLRVNENNEYIVIKKKYTIALLLLMLVFLLIGSVYAITKDYKTDIPINSTGNSNIANIVTTNEMKEMRIVISSYIECNQEKMKNMNMRNLNDDRYMRYVFYNNDNVIYDSYLIESGRTIQEDNLKEKLEKGEYTVKCKVESYDLDKKIMGYHFVETVLSVK